jgi:putative Mn2+ efflux pump MntP
VIPLTALGLNLPLALDTFAVSAAVGLTGPTWREQVRLSLVFALFEGGMPVVGILLGGSLDHTLGPIADYAAIVILIAFGAYSSRGGEQEEEARASRMATVRGPALILIGLSVSLDELAIGFTLGLLGVPLLPYLVAIAVQTLVVSQLGFRLGASLSSRVREGAERVAGIALIALGLILLVEHLG